MIKEQFNILEDCILVDIEILSLHSVTFRTHVAAADTAPKHYLLGYVCRHMYFIVCAPWTWWVCLHAGVEACVGVSYIYIIYIRISC